MTFQSRILALAALALPASAVSQTAAPVDLTTSPSIPGSWSYRPTATGSEAAFMDSSAVRRTVVACTSATRVVTLSVTSTVPASALTVVTSEAGRAVAARFDAKAFQVTADVAARDPLLDSIAFSRGRIALSIPGLAPLVIPAWAEAARVVEDCRG